MMSVVRSRGWWLHWILGSAVIRVAGLGSTLPRRGSSASHHSAVSCQSFCAGLSVSHGLAAGNMCPVVRRDRSHRIQGVETVAGKADNSSNRLKFKVTSYNEFRSGCHGVEILLMTAVRVWDAVTAVPRPRPRPGLQGYTVIHYWIALHCAER